MDRVEIRTGETGPEGPQDENIVNEIITDDEQEAQGVAEERPDWLPEKFNTPEEMANAYAEAERKISQGTQEEEYEYEEQEEPKAETTEEGEEYYESMTPESLAGYTEELGQSGSLSEESYEEITEKFGIPRAVAEAYVDGQMALQQQMIADIMGTVGGEQNYAEMIQWGQNNFSEDEQKTFDATIAEGNIDSIKLAVSGVWARMQQDRGPRGKLIQGNTPASTNNSFQSIAEITDAMKDPRYKKDPAYRAEVQRRLASSKAI